jgi:hypothetical protein
VLFIGAINLAEYIWSSPRSERSEQYSWGNYDDTASTFGTWRLVGLVEPNTDYGKAIIRFSGWTVNRLERWRSPPTTAGPVVDGSIQDVLRSFAGEADLVFYPVSLICRDGVSHSYSFVSPRHSVRCLDFARSDLTLDRINEQAESVFEWKKLYFVDNCLGSRHIAWDWHLPGRIVVSEVLKEAIEKLGDPGIEFYLPENYEYI